MQGKELNISNSLLGSPITSLSSPSPKAKACGRVHNHSIWHFTIFQQDTVRMFVYIRYKDERAAEAARPQVCFTYSTNLTACT